VSDPVLLDVRDGVARLTLNRSDTGNPVSLEAAGALRDHARSLQGREDVRAVILGAAGPNFSVGGDLRYMHEAEETEAAVLALVEAFHEGVEALLAVAAPLVTAVRGAAAGGGMSLAMIGDIVVASQTARFTMAYTQIGFSPDGGATWTLPRIVGWRRAAELMLLNERIDADGAREMGLVTRVVDDEQLEEKAGEIAARLASGSTPAFGAVRRLLRESATSTLTEQLAAEAPSISKLAASPDGREGVSAFFEKRAPAFGR
jgi:2-(1,2-epoxy-1,2-dihydrophenyl)acetyl-CoA isomerase